jgi:hypothetical protein
MSWTIESGAINWTWKTRNSPANSTRVAFSISSTIWSTRRRDIRPLTWAAYCSATHKWSNMVSGWDVTDAGAYVESLGFITKRTFVSVLIDFQQPRLWLNWRMILGHLCTIRGTFRRSSENWREKTFSMSNFQSMQSWARVPRVCPIATCHPLLLVVVVALWSSSAADDCQRPYRSKRTFYDE